MPGRVLQWSLIATVAGKIYAAAVVYIRITTPINNACGTRQSNNNIKIGTMLSRIHFAYSVTSLEPNVKVAPPA